MPTSHFFADDVINKTILKLRKPRQFRVIFARNFLKIYIYEIDNLGNDHMMKRI